MIVKLSDNRWYGGWLQSRVVNVGGGDVDKLKDGSHKTKVVPRSAKKLTIPSHLVWGVRKYHGMQETGPKRTSSSQAWINFSNAVTAFLAAPTTLSTSNHARNPCRKKPRRVETTSAISPLASIRWLYQDLQATATQW